MFTVLIDQIEHLDSFFIQSYCVGQVYRINGTIQFSERKLNERNRCEWSSNTIAPANSMLRQYDAVDHILSFYLFSDIVTLFSNNFICVYVQNCKFIIAALMWSKHIRYCLPLPVSDIYSFLLTKSNKNLLAEHYFVTSTILSCEVCSFSCVEKPAT